MNDKVTKLNHKQEMIISIIVPFIIVYFLMSYVFGVVVIRGDSMQPTYSHGDTVLILRTGYVPDYGDVLVCTGNGYPIIKRVVGKGGDTISIENEKIAVNGLHTTITDTISFETDAVKMPHTVADDSYFVIGDNTTASIDSRFSSVGDIHQAQIIGKVILKIRGNDNE